MHLPPDLVRQVDVVARDEMRSRSNTVKWLLTEAVQRREPAEVEPEAS